jgi:predicted DNA-binding transcriptional regulator YafY
MASSNDKNYNQIAFALEILRLLAEKPLKREELGQLLIQFLEKNGKASEDVLQKLTRTIRKLRDCGFQIKSAPHHPYELIQSNFPLILSQKQRQALYLAAYFLADMGFSEPASQTSRLGNFSEQDRPPGVRVNFSPPVDYSEEKVNTIVQQLQQRIEQQCYFIIRYQNSQKEERNWDLGFSELRLHHGVLYLFAFVKDLPSSHRLKFPNVEHNLLFRVDRIKFVMASSNDRWFWREFPTLTIRYRLMGSLANYQPRRDHETIIEYNHEKKYVEIETKEDCLFWFRQRILQYGANAQVLEPKWLAEEIAQELKLAYQKYNILA